MTMLRRMLPLVILLFVGLTACTSKETPGGHRIRVVTTLFPLYDFARQVGGDKVEVSLLLPPGVEAHSFEPKPEDVVKVHKADLFIYTSAAMEPWVTKLLQGTGGGKTVIVEAGKGASYLNGEGDHHEESDGHAHRGGLDPHIWLSIPNARKMVQNIAAALASRDPGHNSFYSSRSQAYDKQLADLDEKFRSGLAQCETRTLLHGGHYAFAYLAQRYGLTYRSAYALSANAEPSPRKVIELVNEMRQNRLKAIFYEELLSPAMSETIAKETGAELVKLHGIHNVSKAEFQGGATYMSLMEQNLENLRKGLRCR